MERAEITWNSLSIFMTGKLLRGGPFLRTGFTIFSMKAFGWVGGSKEGARKNWKRQKTRPLLKNEKRFLMQYACSILLQINVF